MTGPELSLLDCPRFPEVDDAKIRIPPFREQTLALIDAKSPCDIPREQGRESRQVRVHCRGTLREQQLEPMLHTRNSSPRRKKIVRVFHLGRRRRMIRTDG